ncbi:Stk1 family PASTA domain-containing Ser/Thr kinase [Glaciihabitans arcticus]|uniref:non-specific serine/threonine protein kinase n=1 Tax=Glaciihabitans arcticus TaxID=2668039 RepID=A0A4Q9GWE3_9MICO|nr:Stk1 family PASTA domain-containing Ser/Thr kinase [Glaciihabitans arcticus]TBN56540.1 Stk1 family PASTA domain-containing Ser/Thr kinase [Glaciihabitans arcticus]
MNTNSTDPTIGRLIDGRYQVRSRIARGGMATVYLATDLRLERRVAIKIMHPHLADDVEFREKFIQEARSAARLAHPNVVNVYDQGQDSETAYLVMEYLPGITLRDLLSEHRTLTSEQTLDILEAVLSGLAAAHKSGIVHRDLKPENVLLADDGRIKLSDFGLARAASANTATGAALLGTIAYLSPELVTRGVADTRSDIYAVGIMMYEMLAGEQPFKGEQPMQIAYQHANDSVPTPSTKNPRVPAELDELVLWATARDPEERPRDARAMLEQLLETQSQLQTALPANATAVQRTVVLPSAQNANSDAETQVLGGARALVPVGAALAVDDAPSALAASADKRRSRGWWLFGLVLLIAGLAGGTGWYFGAGPGSTVTIPSSVVGMTPEAATAVITELGLTVEAEIVEEHDPIVENGKVSSTDPAVDTAIGRDAVVTIRVSIGPKPVIMPDFIGLTEEAATVVLTDAGLIVQTDERIEQFNADVPVGSIVGAYGINSDEKLIGLKNETEYFDQRPVTLIVSAGALPSVKGKSFDEAVAILDGVGLVGEAGKETFDDDVPKGAVISIAPKPEGAAIRKGDSVFVIVSRGPDLVEIPNVVGETIADAIEQLEGAGFTVDVRTLIPRDRWDDEFAVVANMEPGSDEKVKRGSTVIIRGDF